jgi:hypothetical protein
MQSKINGCGAKSEEGLTKTAKAGEKQQRAAARIPLRICPVAIATVCLAF